MTGTSLDAVDVALVRASGVGLSLRAELLAFHSIPLGELAEPLERFSTGSPRTAEQIAGIARDAALLHNAAIRALLDRAGLAPDLIAMHGQTVFHSPPLSWQLAAPAVVAAEFGAPVVYDLRAADLAAGGQGAPITPLADYVLFRDPGEARCVLNLGGFANFTWLPPAGDDPERDATRIAAGDLCVCNRLLDAAARRWLGARFDEDGGVASRGRVLPAFADALTARLARQTLARRSLGSGDDDASMLDGAPPAETADLLRSVVFAVASCIAEAIARAPRSDRVLCAGGGTRHRVLLTELQRLIAGPVRSVADVGIDPSAREAAEIAILGLLCQDGLRITLPQVTGARRPTLAGAWMYGDRSRPRS